jgi:hypothetical protein
MERLVEQVLEIAAQKPGINKGQLQQAVGGKHDKLLDQAIREAEALGRMRVERNGSSHRHYALPETKLALRVEVGSVR